MKYIIASDIHGSLFYTKKLENIIKQENCDKIILLGDIYYHGPRNPLPKDYNPMQVAKILNELSNQLICIKGNCDAEVDEMISEFSFCSDYILDIQNQKILLSHGHKIDFDRLEPDIDIFIYGHYHTGFIQKHKDKILINPGSISLPKENTPNSYIMINNNTIYLKNLNTNQIIDRYNIY